VADGAGFSEGADGRYWAGLREGRLELPQCDACGLWRWPAVWRCGDCGSFDLTWKPVPMVGRVYSWTRTWHPFGGTEGVGVPFVSLIVELPGAGGRRLVGILEDAQAADPQIGAAVEGFVSSTRFDGTDIPTIKWRLVESKA